MACGAGRGCGGGHAARAGTNTSGPVPYSRGLHAAGLAGSSFRRLASAFHATGTMKGVGRIHQPAILPWPVKTEAYVDAADMSCAGAAAYSAGSGPQVHVVRPGSMSRHKALRPVILREAGSGSCHDQPPFLPRSAPKLALSRTFRLAGPGGRLVPTASKISIRYNVRCIASTKRMARLSGEGLARSGTLPKLS
jgi:hypothetical protein